MKFKLSIEKYGQFIKFCIVGAVNTTISLVVYGLLLKLNVHYLTASTIAYLAGILNGYIFSSSFVFKAKFRFIQGLKFIGVYLSSLLINLFLLYFLVDIFQFNEFVGQICVTGFNVIYNYLLNKFWTFSK
ncbi:GtrA family protein [Bacillus sp. OK048]|uniref:GtrA family protein n=1 Tax=Bacillus sp. OK048 TaxID=1882761 RepID=UPI0008843AAF|nr:GtrA family protein [Bacillus sp. OK048]SDM69907.1 Putative flippase GtrA (transmembrane translocase of bactoprenol-linked glucose) [Bacillus sp. OK048]